LRFHCAVLVLSSSVVLSGCVASSYVSNNTVQTGGRQGTAFQGRVHGGQQPIVGASVYLYAANTTGNAGPGIAASIGNASISLLNSGTKDGGGNYYVTTDSGGNFSITGDYVCPSAISQVYIYSVGGNPGAGINPAAGLLAGLGSCGALSSTAFVMVNEVSTIATAYSIAGFATDATHVSSSGSTLAQTGIANAFQNVTNLETLSTGAALTATPAGNGAVPQTLLDTLANILASCVNGTGAVTGPANPTPCYTLFNDAQSSGASGSVPSDTASAAINIAHNPGSNISALFSLPTTNPPFEPAILSLQQPNDFTVVLAFAGGGMNEPTHLAIDASGDVWAANQDSDVTELSSTGAFLSGATGYDVGVTGHLIGIAVDPSGNVWVVNNLTPSIIELSSDGSVLSGASGFTGGVIGPTGIAIDGSGNAWISVSETPASGVAELSNSGAALSGAKGYTSTGFLFPDAIAIDDSGNVWAATSTNPYGVLELSNAGIVLSPAAGFDIGMIPSSGIAIDSDGDAWLIDYSSGRVSEISSSGTVLSGSSGFTDPSLVEPEGIAIDGAGNIWFPDSSALVEFSHAGTALSGTHGYRAATEENGAIGVAVDGSGNVWVGGVSGITETIGAATPVVTPLSLGIKNQTLATRP
jgi:hypothetical protein